MPTFFNFKGLDKELDRIAKDVIDIVDDAGQEAARTYLRVAGLRTAVKTGKARSNHIVSLGAPSNRIRPPFAPLVRGNINERRNLDAMTSVGNQTIARWKPSSGTNLFTVNNLPYIDFLDAGGSPQSPTGFSVEAERRALKALELSFRRGFAKKGI